MGYALWETEIPLKNNQIQQIVKVPVMDPQLLKDQLETQKLQLITEIIESNSTKLNEFQFSQSKVKNFKIGLIKIVEKISIIFTLEEMKKKIEQEVFMIEINGSEPNMGKQKKKDKRTKNTNELSLLQKEEQKKQKEEQKKQKEEQKKKLNKSKTYVKFLLQTNQPFKKLSPLLNVIKEYRKLYIKDPEE